MTKGQFSLLDLIRAVLRQTGPAHVALSTWSSGIRDIENAAWLLESGQIQSLRMLTDRSFATRQPSYCTRLVAAFGNDAIRATNVHAKFALITNDRWSIAIRSSMNLNRNKRWEQFDLDDDATIVAHFERLITEMERVMPAGPRPLGSEVEDGFDAALAEELARPKAVEGAGDPTQLARLGYTAAEVAQRMRQWPDMTDHERGALALADQMREATITAALGGCLQSRNKVNAWIQAQARTQAGDLSHR
ncbi:MAG: hypothetical protein ACYTFV_02525 [Planctomycetota bacterium]